MLNLIRKAIGKTLLVADTLTAPTPAARDSAAQSRIDEECRRLAVYELEGCPFCIKTRRAMRRLNLKIERRDVGKNPRYQDELMAGGKVDQVPCLRIEEKDNVRWLYESSDIINYLEQRFPT